MKKPTLLNNPFIKRSKKYDAPCFVLNADKLDTLSSAALKNFDASNSDFVSKITDENSPFALENKQLYFNALIRKSFEDFSNVQEDKMNIIIHNPVLDHDRILQDIESIQDVKERMKKAKRNHLDTENIPFSNTLILLIMKSEHFLKFFDKFFSGLPVEYYIDEAILPYMETYFNILNPDFLKKNVYSSFFRFEFDFKNEHLSIYSSYATFNTTGFNNFAPWNGDLHEKLCYSISFFDLKIFNLSKFLAFHKDSDYENHLSETKETISLKSIERVRGPIPKNIGCPIYQCTDLALEFVMNGYFDILPLSTSFILNNNIIYKDKKSTRVLTPSKSKKGKPKYKSIVKEYYVLDENALEESLQDSKFRIDAYTAKLNALIESKTNTSEPNQSNTEHPHDFTYTQEEWTVRPHTRRYKSGKVVQIAGTKKKRNPDLLSSEYGVTYGISDRDIKKISKNI